MKLRLQDKYTLVLMELCRGLEALGSRPVLVGGLVPPLLLETLDLFSFEVTPDPRRTTDCDVAILERHRNAVASAVTQILDLSADNHGITEAAAADATEVRAAFHFLVPLANGPRNGRGPRN